MLSWQMDSGANFTIDISEWLNISNMIVVYRTSANVKNSWQMLRHNANSSSLDYV
jgi:hypothetical protein